MKIEPLQGVVYIQTATPKVGAFDTSSRDSAVEFAEVIGVGEGIKNISIGDKIFVKAWAIDLVNYEGVWYKFINIETNGILAKVHEADA